MSKEIISKKKKFITDFKTKRINEFTGGKIADYVNKKMCFEDKDDKDPSNFTLENSFLALDGTYLGNYKEGWWYFKQNMVICIDHPHGVSIILKQPVKDYPHLDDYKSHGGIEEDYIKGYYGFSHRGGCIFAIGNRFFDESYEPKKEDYTEKEWSVWEKERIATIDSDLEGGVWDTKDVAEGNNPISHFIPFNRRGFKDIETWEEAKQAAINMSNYLS